MNAAISVRAVSRWYGDLVAVNDISFDLEPGVTGLLGPNGAGSRRCSTCCHILILDEPFNGTDPRQRLQMTEMLKELGNSGRTVVFSSHILEDVEHLAEDVLVIIGGRLAAAGDFRQIRRLMTNRPHAFTIRSSNNRALAAGVVDRPHIALVSFDNDPMEVKTTDFGAFTETITPLIQSSGIDLHELQPSDDSLENVFSYLVAQ